MIPTTDVIADILSRIPVTLPPTTLTRVVQWIMQHALQVHDMIVHGKSHTEIVMTALRALHIITL